MSTKFLGSMIILNPQRCKGCRLCETACSFHHSGHNSFNPSKSSTKISRDNDTAIISISIDSTCDLCHEEDTYLCVKYCKYGARGIHR